MSRGQGGYIGFNRVPAASALNSAASGVWSLREAEALKRAGTWPVSPTDQYFNEVSLLLNLNGANQSTTFTDSSLAARAATRVGSAVISTTQSKFGGASLNTGNGNYIRFADNDAFHFTGDFTIEAWIRLTSHPTSYDGDFASGVIVQDDGSDSTNSYGWSLIVSGSSSQTLNILLTSSTGTRTLISGTANLALDTWYHIAAVRSSNTVYLFKDGVLLNAGGTSYTATLRNSTATVKIGASDFDSTYKYWFYGFIDDVRITKGVARYTTDFTPPGAELTL